MTHAWCNDTQTSRTIVAILFFCQLSSTHPSTTVHRLFYELFYRDRLCVDKYQAAERKERKESKNIKRMGEDGIGDDDLQVVSGERDLENLHPKERAKLEKKRGLIRAGMGVAADDAEDTGFEVAKASGAAMAMLGKRYKPKFAVDGLDVQDEREYGSDQVRS